MNSNKISQIFFYFMMLLIYLYKRQNMNFVYTLHHIVDSKTTLAYTAAYNANTHPECFILVNLDQSVTKQATAI